MVSSTEATNEASRNLIDPQTMSYEQAKDELRQVVQTLESGSIPLEETLELWQRGESLATRCRSILEAASAKIEEMTAQGGGQVAAERAE
ncbi:exodeoxyribonuclease VII small subunit [Actinomycetaceae bacterium MB13-C1-2]|nr:exodeoxyribonuclease VII small subunit [Actinomycetaceae bacterium MB13-C1-2]